MHLTLQYKKLKQNTNALLYSACFWIARGKKLQPLYPCQTVNTKISNLEVDFLLHYCLVGFCYKKGNTDSNMPTNCLI